MTRPTGTPRCDGSGKLPKLLVAQARWSTSVETGEPILLDRARGVCRACQRDLALNRLTGRLPVHNEPVRSLT